MGYNFSNRFPQIVAALTVLPVRSTRLVSHRPHRRSVNKRLTKDESQRASPPTSPSCRICWASRSLPLSYLS
jgi:hypothetical protein